MDPEELKEVHALLCSAVDLLMQNGLDAIAGTVDLAVGEIEDLMEGDEEEEESYE